MRSQSFATTTTATVRRLSAAPFPAAVLLLSSRSAFLLLLCCLPSPTVGAGAAAQLETVYAGPWNITCYGGTCSVLSGGGGDGDDGGGACSPLPSTDNNVLDVTAPRETGDDNNGDANIEGRQYCPGGADSCLRDVNGVVEVPAGCVLSCSNCVMGEEVVIAVTGGNGGRDERRDDDDDAATEAGQGALVVSGGGGGISDGGEEEEEKGGEETFACHFCPPGTSFQRKWVKIGGARFGDDGKSLRCGDAIPMTGNVGDETTSEEEACRIAREELARDADALAKCGYCVTDSVDDSEDDGNSSTATDAEKVAPVSGAAVNGDRPKAKNRPLCTLCPEGETPLSRPNKAIAKVGVGGGGGGGGGGVTTTCGHVARLMPVANYNRKECRRERRRYRSECACREGPRVKNKKKQHNATTTISEGKGQEGIGGEEEEEEDGNGVDDGAPLLSDGKPNTTDDGGDNDTAVNTATTGSAASPTTAPSRLRLSTTFRPTAEPTTNTPRISDDLEIMTVEVNVTLAVHNALGLTARDVLEGATVPGRATLYRTVLERAARLVWTAKYSPGDDATGEPTAALAGAQGENAGVGAPPHSKDGEEILQLEGARNDHRLRARRDDSGGGRAGVRKQRRRLHTIPTGGLRRRSITLRSRTLSGGATNLALVIEEPALASGINVICPPSVPRRDGGASGAVNACQNFTITLAVEGAAVAQQREGDDDGSSTAVVVEEERSIRNDVMAAYDESHRDGTLAAALDGFFGVTIKKQVATDAAAPVDDEPPRGEKGSSDEEEEDAAPSGDGDGTNRTDSGNNSTDGSVSPDAAGRSSGAAADDGGGSTANVGAIVGGTVAGALGLLCCCLGVFARTKNRREHKVSSEAEGEATAVEQEWPAPADGGDDNDNDEKPRWAEAEWGADAKADEQEWPPADEMDDNEDDEPWSGEAEAKAEGEARAGEERPAAAYDMDDDNDDDDEPRLKMEDF